MKILLAGTLAGLALLVGGRLALAEIAPNPELVIVKGDMTCDLEVDAFDLIVMLRAEAGLSVIGQECTPVGTAYQAAPPCQEDEIIVGVGDFHATGYWDSYTCSHPDLGAWEVTNKHP